jgi:hypothetical protein
MQTPIYSVWALPQLMVTKNWPIGIYGLGSLRLDPHGLDNFAPFLSFFHDELSEVAR